MLKFFKFLKQHKKILILCIGLLILLPPVVIHILYKVPSYNDFFKSEWDPGDLLNYCGGCLSLLGTLILGVIAIEQSNFANELNEKLLNFEKNMSKPYLTIESGQICKIYLRENIFVISRKYDRKEKIVIFVGAETSSLGTYTLFEMNITNSGTLEIAYINVKKVKIEWTNENLSGDYKDYKIDYCIWGNTGIKKDETRKLFVYIAKPKEIDELIDKHRTKLIMPVIKFELQLFTVSGERFTELLEISATEWDTNMVDNNKLIERAIYPKRIEVQ